VVLLLLLVVVVVLLLLVALPGVLGESSLATSWSTGRAMRVQGVAVGLAVWGGEGQLLLLLLLLGALPGNGVLASQFMEHRWGLRRV
jgi:hypothetical protein